jgi:hypothetical protein
MEVHAGVAGVRGGERRLHVEFEDVFVLEDVAALDALAVVAGAVPEPGELEVLGEVFVQVQGRVGHRRADGQNYGVAQFDRLARLLGVDPDDFEHGEDAAFQFFQAGVMFDRDRQHFDVANQFPQYRQPVKRLRVVGFGTEAEASLGARD